MSTLSTLLTPLTIGESTMLRRLILLCSLLMFAHAGHAAQIDYEIYSVDVASKPTLLAKGVKQYGDADLAVDERKSRGSVHWSKSLELEGGFFIGASIYREPAVTGFGLWAQRSPCGFSWEWFNASTPGRFEKLQETGRVSVTYRSVGKLKEISEIAFDTDVSLRLNESQDIDRDTHRILVKSGSVLKFPPAHSPNRSRAGGAAPACAGR